MNLFSGKKCKTLEEAIGEGKVLTLHFKFMLINSL